MEKPQSGVFEGMTSKARGHHKFVDLEEFCFFWCLRWTPGSLDRLGKPHTAELFP